MENYFNFWRCTTPLDRLHRNRLHDEDGFSTIDQKSDPFLTHFRGRGVSFRAGVSPPLQYCMTYSNFRFFRFDFWPIVSVIKGTSRQRTHGISKYFIAALTFPLFLLRPYIFRAVAQAELNCGPIYFCRLALFSCRLCHFSPQ